MAGMERAMAPMHGREAHYDRISASDIAPFWEQLDWPAASSAVLCMPPRKDAQSAALHERLVVDPHDILLDKPRFGAFHGTDLELILRARGIETVIIAGIATKSVVRRPLARHAVRDFRVFFPSDGTTTFGMGGASAAELQKATLATLGFFFAQVLTINEIMQKISRGARTTDA